jgi:ice-binding like protein
MIMKSTIGRALRASVPSARIARLVLALGAAAVASTACDVHGISNPGTISTISISPNPQTLAANATQQFTVVASDFSGAQVAVKPTWSVVTGGGTISATGMFTAGPTAGTFTNTVKATSGSASATATVVVTVATGAPGTTGTPAAPPLVTITVTPNPDTTQIGAAQQFNAVGRDGNGNISAITPVWSVVNGGGSIDANTGRFTAGPAAGTFANTVRATSGTVSGTATVVILATVPPPQPSLIDLGAAAPNGIMAGTAVTCVNGGTINADVSVSPGNTVTGFGPCVITGVQHLGDATAAQAQIDLTKAYNTLAGLPCPPANAIVANLGGTTKAAGVYCTASGIGVTGVLTLDGGGNPNATFVFQAGSTLTTAGDVVLINGAQAKNVYWQVGTSATIGTASHWQGNILAHTSITLVDNATLHGRALARDGAVSLGSNNVITLP